MKGYSKSYLYELPSYITKEDYHEAFRRGLSIVFIGESCLLQSEDLIKIKEYLEDYIGLELDPNNLI